MSKLHNGEVPKISVITPCYNAAPYITKTVQSVINQDLSDWEYVIVDDGSTDESPRQIEQAINGDPRIRYVRQENSGVAAARNFGVVASDDSSEYLVFLDADDVLDPSFLRLMSAHLDQSPEAGLAYCSLIEIDENGLPLQTEPAHEIRFIRDGISIGQIPSSEPLTPLESLFSRFNAIPSTSMFRRSVFEQTQGWRQSGVVEDKDMGIQMACQAPVHFVAQHLTKYRQHRDQRHLDGFYRSLHDLNAVWWNTGQNGRYSQQEIRGAIVFDRRLAAQQSRRAALELTRSRRFSEANPEFLRSLRHSSAAVSAWLRMRRGVPGRHIGVSP